MKTALFIMFPVPSHYNICFGLADSLRQQGYRVVFAGTKNVQRHIENQKFEFEELQYMQEIVVYSWKAVLGLLIASALDKKLMKARYREFLRSILAVQNLCKHVKPDEIYIDEHLNFYYLLLKSDYANSQLVNTKLPNHRVSGIPPLTCSIPFKNNMFYKACAWILWEYYLVKQYFIYWRKHLSLLGTDELFFLKRVTIKMGVQIDPYINMANLLHTGLINAPIIHLVPRAMEYSWYKLEKNEHFFYQPYQRKIEKDKFLFWKNIDSLLNQSESRKIQLVYASLGSLTENNIRIANIFLGNLIAVFKALPDVHLILTNSQSISSPIKDIPTNVHIFNWVPQTAILPYCDLMITHGGTNSILECVQAKVPLLSYPLNLSADHSGNTARVVANGWGLQGNMRKANQKNIQQNIKRMLTEPNLTSARVKITPINDW